MSALFRRAGIGLVALALAACSAARASEDMVEDDAFGSAPSAEAAPAAVAERQAFLRAKLAAALAQLAPIKTMTTEHYFMTGAWPSRPADVGLEPAELTSSVIAGVSFEGDGAIVARLCEDFGKGAALRLVPQPVMGGTSLEWRCRANLPPALLRTLPCEATP